MNFEKIHNICKKMKNFFIKVYYTCYKHPYLLKNECKILNVFLFLASSFFLECSNLKQDVISFISMFLCCLFC